MLENFQIPVRVPMETGDIKTNGPEPAPQGAKLPSPTDPSMPDA